MTEQTNEFNPAIIDSLLHPLAQPIRRLLTREGRRELNQFIIDDEENILQALEAEVEIDSVYYAGDEVISETLRKKLTAGATIHEVAKRTTKKLFENDKISRIFAIAQTPMSIGLEALKSIQKDIVVLEDLSISGNIGNITRTFFRVLARKRARSWFRNSSGLSSRTRIPRQPRKGFTSW